MASKYNLRSSTSSTSPSTSRNKPSYEIEVVKSPPSQILSEKEIHSTTSRNKPSYVIEVEKSPNSQILPEKVIPTTPKTPRMLPKIPISINNMDPEYIDRIQILERELAEIRINFINLSTDNSHLKDRVDLLEDDKNEILTNLVTLEKNLDRLNQYGRRENIELSGIPMYIPQNELEDVVIDILRFIGLEDLESYDISGCHRIHKNNVIVRFVNRKHSIKSLKNRKYLKGCKREFGYNQNVYMNENLCPAYRSIEEKCRTLLDCGHINQMWTYNGAVNIKFTNERTEKSKKLYHEDDLKYHFPDYDDNFYL